MNQSAVKLLAGIAVVVAVGGIFLAWPQLGGMLLSQKADLAGISFSDLVSEAAGFEEEKSYLALFQNNLELRPGGGFLGNFAIIKVRDAQVVSFEVHDTNIFDGFSRVQTEPPPPMKKYLHINNWQMRDANWSPDFPTAAKQAEDFYHLQGGTESFDGVIGINATLLPEILDITGPIILPEINKEFNRNNVLYELEYELEKGYVQRGVDRGARKELFKVFVQQVKEKATTRGIFSYFFLKNLFERALEEKEMVVFFHDQRLQTRAAASGWTGSVSRADDGDYLMLVEANLGAYKSNYFVDRAVDYEVDFSPSRPSAKLRIKFSHRNPAKDWFNADYRFYLRVYVPQGSWLTSAEGVNDETQFLDELGKTVFGNWVVVPAGTEKMVEFQYLLPERLRNSEGAYKILVQKQIGVDELGMKITVNGESSEGVIVKDWKGEGVL